MAKNLNLKQQFTSPNGEQLMTIVAHEGKSGFNFHVTVNDLTIKKEKGKKVRTAETGMRETFKTADEAEAMFNTSVKEAKKHGWQLKAGAPSKNAFTTLPLPKSDTAAKKTAVK